VAVEWGSGCSYVDGTTPSNREHAAAPDRSEQIRRSAQLFLVSASLQHQHGTASIHHGRSKGEDGAKASESRMEDDGCVSTD